MMRKEIKNKKNLENFENEIFEEKILENFENEIFEKKIFSKILRNQVFKTKIKFWKNPDFLVIFAKILP